MHALHGPKDASIMTLIRRTGQNANLGGFGMIVLFGKILPTADHEHFLWIFSFTFKKKNQPYIGDSIY